jgi:arylsulfatase A-like enzyme
MLQNKNSNIIRKNKMNRRHFLKTAAATTAGLTFGSRAIADRTQKKPNIVFVLADDLGWAELGCYGSTFNETPNLDRLATQGTLFTDAYAAAPVCSPFRAALMTGQYPARVGITDYLRPKTENHLALDHITIAEALKQNGYATGIIGKWHLSGYKNHGSIEETLPHKHGFDEVIVSENRGIGGGSYFHPYHFNREIKKRLPGKEYLVDRCNLEAVEFIERHKDEPFFLFLSHYAVHTALLGTDDLVARYENKPNAGKGRRAKKNNPHLAAQLETIDKGVGMIMKKLDALGLADNTILIFTSDNGGEDRVTDNSPLRAGKSTLYEGGIREPLIVRWPGKAKANAKCNTPVSTYDFYPTLLDCADIQPNKKQHLDGLSFAPLLKNPKAKLNRDCLYWHYPLAKPHFLGGKNSSAIRCGQLKLIEYLNTGNVELYNLKDDIGEQNNLAEKLPKQTAQLKQQLAKWRKDVGAKQSSNLNKRNGA